MPIRYMPTIAVLGTLDTKGLEHAFVADTIRSLGHVALLIDTGTTNKPQVKPDVFVTDILPKFKNPQDRGSCVQEIALAAAEYLRRLGAEGKIDGIISLGGGGGTSIGTAAMRASPLGIPKVMVSTLASGNTAPYVGTSDIVMMPAIVDVSGLNRLSRTIFKAAAHAVCAMAEARCQESGEAEASKPLIVASMFGNTTACVSMAKEELESAGFEVLVFHATGTGGQTMEALIASGMVAGVLDVTTTEIADEICGGVLTAGSTRLSAAGKAGIPSVIAPGCLDMVNFGPRSTVPEQYRSRTFYQHNEQVTLMRTSPDENRAMGEFLADKLNQYQKSPAVMIPLKGLSVISQPGGVFYSPEADQVLFETLKSKLNPAISLEEIPHGINDPEFAIQCARKLIEMIPPIGAGTFLSP